MLFHIFHPSPRPASATLEEVAQGIPIHMPVRGKPTVLFLSHWMSPTQLLAFTTIFQEIVPSGYCGPCWAQLEMCRLFGIYSAPLWVVRDFILLGLLYRCEPESLATVERREDIMATFATFFVSLLHKFS